DFYQNKGRVKWLIFGISLLIGLGSIYYTDTLVAELKEREKKQIDLFARALEYAANNSDNLTFINQEIIVQNHDIPVIIADAFGNIKGIYRNIHIEEDATAEEITEKLKVELQSMKEGYEPIVLAELDQYIYYNNSTLLISLAYYPYVQLSVILVFGLL